MRIDESRIFEFRFPFYGGEFSIPIRAQTKEEASDILRNHLQQWMIELATEFPRSAPAEQKVERTVKTEPPASSAIPSFALELDIENLVKEIMPIKKTKGAQTVER